MSGWDGWAYDADGNIVKDWPLLPDGVVEWAAVCTGRESHQERALCQLLDRRSTEHGDVRGWQAPKTHGDDPASRASNRMSVAVGMAYDGARGGVLQLPRCPSCGRKPRIGQASLARALDGFEQLSPGRRVVDVSYAP